MHACRSTLEDPTDLDDVVVATHGGTPPQALIESLAAVPGLVLDTFATLIDAPSFIREFAARQAIFDKLAANEVQGVQTVENLMAEQVQCASVLLLSKLDQVRKEEMPAMIKCLARLNPETKAHAVDHGKVPPGRLLGTGSFRMPHFAPRAAPPRTAANAPGVGGPAGGTGPTEAAAEEIGSMLLSDPRPFHPRRLWEKFQQAPEQGIHRTKGIIWLASRDEEVLRWEQDGARMGLHVMAYWKAPLVFDTHSRLLPGEREALEEQLHNSHPVFGDRLNELTIIGTERDRKRFAKELEDCFCTPEEIRHWQMGECFEDPWPKTLDRR